MVSKNGQLNDQKNDRDQYELNLRKPTACDGMAVHGLISRCEPLDVNSSYCNLLQCSHFSDTSILAEHDGEVVGFISGYRIPNAPETLFVWQVAIDSRARGQGLASRLLSELFRRCQSQRTTEFLETSITDANQASWRTFERFAREANASLNTSILFDKDDHFRGCHDTECLVRIGPIESGALPS